MHKSFLPLLSDIAVMTADKDGMATARASRYGETRRKGRNPPSAGRTPLLTRPGKDRPAQADLALEELRVRG